MLHGILWWKGVHNYHLKISSPWGSREMASPQAFHSHCDLYHWSAIYRPGQSSTSFTPESGIGFQSARDTTASLVEPTGTTFTDDWICADAREKHGKGIFCRNFEDYWVKTQLWGPRFCPCCPEVPFLPCWSSRGAASLAAPPAIQRWGQSVVCIQVSPGASCLKLLGEGFQNRDEQYFHTELFIQIATNTHSASGIFLGGQDRLLCCEGVWVPIEFHIWGAPIELFPVG